jgi:hypothetical protein
MVPRLQFADSFKEYISKHLLVALIVPICFLESTFAQTASPAPSSDTGELDITTKYVEHCHVNAYGQSIDVYVNVFTKDGAPQSGGVVKYYYCPHPVIDRAMMKAAFDAIPVPTPQSATSPTPSSKGIPALYTLPIHVDFMSLNVEEEIAVELSGQGKSTDKHHVSRVPFRVFKYLQSWTGKKPSFTNFLPAFA